MVDEIYVSTKISDLYFIGRDYTIKYYEEICQTRGGIYIGT